MMSHRRYKATLEGEGHLSTEIKNAAFSFQHKHLVYFYAIYGGSTGFFLKKEERVDYLIQTKLFYVFQKHNLNLLK